MSRYWIHSAPEDYTGETGLRECARAERCTDPRIDTVDGKTIRLPALTPRPFCDSCSSGIEHCTRELPALYRRLHAELGNRGQAAGPKVAASKTPPLPINLDVDAALRDMAHVLVSWQERVATVAGLHTPDTGTSRHPGYTVVRDAAATLAAHHNVLLALCHEPMLRHVSLREAAGAAPGTPGLVHTTALYADVLLDLSGVDAGLEILRLHYRCRRLLGETRIPARHLPTPCGRCGFAELYETLDGDGAHAGARCRQCREDYTAESYADLAAVQSATVRAAGARVRRPLLVGAGDDMLSGRA